MSGGSGTNWPVPGQEVTDLGQLTLRRLVKRFGDDIAVDRLDLDIRAGEFFSLLGASGCGKTTTLRLIAGFEEPDDGEIVLDGTDLVDVPAHRRPVNTVFQSYALFPFLSVWDNVAFGLRYQHASKQEANERVGRALELVEMTSRSKRRPHQLSGGQQQRVALARALVLQPTVLLLDEPLGALDAKLRKQLQAELRELQRTVHTTFVYVTHDQEEALTMSDRLAILVDGHVEQVGSPSDMYSSPATAYVAGFLGTANLYDAKVDSIHDGVADCRVGDLRILARTTGHVANGEPVSVVVRPERVELCELGAERSDSHTNTYPARVDRLTFLGAQTHVTLAIDGERMVAEVANLHGQPPAWLHEGERIGVCISTSAAQLIPGSRTPQEDQPADGVSDGSKPTTGADASLVD